MGGDLRLLAMQIAEEPYAVKFAKDQTVEGDEVWFLTMPELPGCMAQGETPEQALDNLRDAQIEYILSLLEDGLPVPGPAPTSTTTVTSVDSDVMPSDDFETDVAKAVRPDYRQDVGEAAWVA